MTSDVRVEGGSAKSDFISKGLIIEHLIRGEVGQKKGKNHLTSYMDGLLLSWVNSVMVNSI